jgi:hypothetical protein
MTTSKEFDNGSVSDTLRGLISQIGSLRQKNGALDQTHPSATMESSKMGMEQGLGTTLTGKRFRSMTIEITDYLDVKKRFSDLGLQAPEGACILPRRFIHAKNGGELCHESSALDLKTLFRQADLPITVYQPDGTKIPYLQENDIRWVGPVLFFSAAAISENPHIVSVALSVIANYLTDIFKGLPQPASAKLSVVIETTTTKTTTKTTKKIEFDGPPDKISEINGLIKDIM